MPHYLTQKTGKTELLSVWKLTETEEQLLSGLNLSEEETLLFSALKNKRRRAEWLATRILLQELFHQHCTITYLPNGKPMLVSPRHYFSLSHSKDFVAVIVSPSKEVGIDVEKRRDNIFDLKEKFLSPAELNTVQPSDNLLLHLYWGAKEAMYKMYSRYQPLFTEHLSLKNIDTQNKKATGIFFQENICKEVEIHFQEIEDNLLVYAWEESEHIFS
jgi:4'-phosphopantetheinyl transferase EntD